MSLSALGRSGSDSISVSIYVSGSGSSPVEGGPPSFRFHRWTASIDLPGCTTIARETERLSANGRVALGVGEVFRAIRAKPNFPTGPGQLVSESESEFIVFVGHSQ